MTRDNRAVRGPVATCIPRNGATPPRRLRDTWRAGGWGKCRKRGDLDPEAGRGFARPSPSVGGFEAIAADPSQPGPRRLRARGLGGLGAPQDGRSLVPWASFAGSAARACLTPGRGSGRRREDADHGRGIPRASRGDTRGLRVRRSRRRARRSRRRGRSRASRQRRDDQDRCGQTSHIRSSFGAQLSQLPCLRDGEGGSTDRRISFAGRTGTRSGRAATGSGSLWPERAALPE
jgi:hypothetical protein